jgi:hypothetical protein
LKFTALLDGVAFDLTSRVEDYLGAAQLSIGGREIVQAFVITAMIVVVDEDRTRTAMIGGNFRLVIDGRSDEDVVFAGEAHGTLQLDDALEFTGQISGFAVGAWRFD